MAATKTSAGGGLTAYRVVNQFGGNTSTNDAEANHVYLYAGPSGSAGFCVIESAGSKIILSQSNVSDLIDPLTQFSNTGNIT